MFAVETYAAVRQFVFIEGKSRREAARVFDLRTGNFLAIDGRAAGGLQLFKLGFEGLPDGRDAGITDAFWARSIGHIFR